MINKYSNSFLSKYRLAWLAFLWLVMVPVIVFGSYMTGMTADEKIFTYQSYVGPLGYIYWIIGEMVPDLTIVLPMISGMLWPPFATYFFCLLLMFVEPPFFRKMKEEKIQASVSDVIEAAAKRHSQA